MKLPRKRLGYSYSPDLQQGEAYGHSFTMGCNISNRVALTQLSSEELQNNQEAKSQVVTSSKQTLYKNALLTSEFTSKSWPLEETER
ncbi:hypothetical protein QYF61_026681 [Mycteria americana]|uniref:Uncharacterized protein n=1 Tax=Mycteria americana TaxID=33587 RepID=A0AAN7PU66_MYCAM|nr:hypothetical protein QYF61_026681 [Mycteria americana]